MIAEIKRLFHQELRKHPGYIRLFRKITKRDTCSLVISPKTVLRLIRTIDSQIRTPFRMLDVGCINGFYENDPFRYFHHFSKKILIGIEAVPYSNPQYSKIIQVCVAPTAGTYPFYIPFFSTWASFLEPDFEKIQQDSRIA